MPPETPAPTASAAPQGSEPSEKLTPARLVSRFLLVPILVTGVCVAVFLMFGLLSYEPKNPQQYLHEIKVRSGERRWEAAFGLAHLLESRSGESRSWVARLLGTVLENPRWQAAAGLSTRIAMDPAAGRDERLVREMISVFEEARGQDPRIRRYLALALGRLGNPLAAEALLGALSDEDPETQIHSMWALGALDEKRAVEPMIALLGHRDPGVRKMAAYTLGALTDARAAGPLARALEDSAPDVAWNAAIALAQLGDRRGVPVLLGLLEPGTFGAIQGMSDLQREQATLEAIRALARLRETGAAPALETLRGTSPDLKVRQAAIDALAELHPE
jgi:hypothetical protein